MGVQRHYRRGTLLIQEGEAGEWFYIVLRGRLRAFLADGQGKELTLGIDRPQDYVGEMSLDGGPRPAHVEALEASTCAVLARQTLLQYMLAHPDFALELMSCIIRRARMVTESARRVAMTDVYGRLVHLLETLAGPADADGRRRLPERMTHQQLAQHLTCSREMVSRLLKGLRTGGYIDVRERSIWLLRPLPPRWS
jgi:CRP/FNR family cyclic AMP-dependent transcriptional regulator